jgi:hypothetical protein
MSAFVKITCINTIGMDSPKFGNETHFISLLDLPQVDHGPMGEVGRGEGSARRWLSNTDVCIRIVRFVKFWLRMEDLFCRNDWEGLNVDPYHW